VALRVRDVEPRAIALPAAIVRDALETSRARPLRRAVREASFEEKAEEVEELDEGL
jgi:hypothetical protein